MPEYYTEETVVTDKYLFISYSHEEKAQVHQVVNWLIGEGVRLWYDADLHNGDIWIEKAKQMLSHDNCIGTIFFNSANSFISDPVAEERRISLEKKEAWEKEGKTFHTFVVNMGKPSTMRLVKQILDPLPDNDKFIKQAFSTQQLGVILRLFPDTRIYSYLDPEEPEAFRPGFWEDLADRAPEVVKKADHTMDELKKQSAAGGIAFKLGKYTVDGKSVPLEWQLLYNREDKAIFLLKQILPPRPGNGLSGWLNGEFKREVFTPEEQAYFIEDIRLLSKEEALEKCAGLMAAGCGWWLSDVTGVLQKMVRENGGIYDKGSNNIRTSWGVRPVLVVDVNTIKDLMNR